MIDTDLRKIIGDNVRRERLKRKMMVNDLADVLGVSAGFIGLIEHGKRGTNIQLLLKIAKAFDIPVESLSQQRNLMLNEPSQSEHGTRMEAINSLTKNLSVKELNFIIDTIRSLKKMKDFKVGDENFEDEECFY